MKQRIWLNIISFLLTFPLYSMQNHSFFSELPAKQKILYLHSCISDTYAPVSGLHFLFLAGLPKNIPLVNRNNMGQFRLEVGRWCLVDFCPLLLGLSWFLFIALSVSQNRNNILGSNLFFDLNGRKVQDFSKGRYWYSFFYFRFCLLLAIFSLSLHSTVLEILA